MQYDYIFINYSFEVMARTSSYDYKGSEISGLYLGHCVDLENAIRLAEAHIQEQHKYGIRFSEQLNLPWVSNTEVA